MTSGYKKAALMIHGLGEVDRQWLLNNLSGKERSLLCSYLDQLSEMQVPARQSVFSELIDGESKTYANVSEAEDTRSKIEHINRASASSVTEALTREPDWMIALILISGEWPWTEEFISMMSEHRRERVREAIEKLALRVRPKLRDAVVDILYQAFCQKTDAAINHTQSRFEALFGKFGTASAAEPSNLGELR